MATRPKVEVSSHPAGGYSVSLDGEFLHPHWVAFLFAGLSANGVSVISGQAQQRSLATWSANFQLDFSRAMQTAQSIDYLALTDQEQLPLVSDIPRLTGFQIQRRTDESLEVRLEANDQLGFLGRLLGKICMLGLFPVEMVISTIGNRIQDTLIFRGIAGMAPSEATRQRLESVLQSGTA
ncbi:hypothetical protein [Planctomicrobium piriforme]|uniref:ACT domain-containing protein n=1 Tax=Planctomicrobium piriforme TaxID=1576369 RepID=A0A1I3HRU2_9PLAN|nr:hypothetical protein [Planctomicrobium piriforme]SFI38277.1 hypothetical protein SAMN05421753_108164 [Planctomicrobium piriforme]